jgi:hypothetical protein
MTYLWNQGLAPFGALHNQGLALAGRTARVLDTPRGGPRRNAQLYRLPLYREPGEGAKMDQTHPRRQ